MRVTAVYSNLDEDVRTDANEMGNQGGDLSRSQNAHRDGEGISYERKSSVPVQEAMPSHVCRLVNPRMLDVSCYFMNNVDPFLISFRYLTVLHLQGRYLVRIQPAIGNLCHLIDLDLSRNLLKHIPYFLGELRTLRRLNLSRNRIVQFPPSMCLCTSLVYLDISRCGLQALPHAIGALTGLQVLQARQNAIRHLPLSFRRLANLTTLDLGDNGLLNAEFVLNLDMFRQLNVLCLDRNKLFFPISAGNCCRWLLFIDYSHNDIGNNFQRFEPYLYPELVELDIRHSNIRQLPDHWQGATQLRRILAKGNKITRLPSSLWQCSKLEVLHFQANSLSRIPRGISILPGLRVLILDSNDFTEFPRETTECTSLELLSLDNNRICNIPKSTTLLSLRNQLTN